MNYDVIVSLTTWKRRIEDPRFLRVLYRLLKEQLTVYKYKVVLVLSEDEFIGRKIPIAVKAFENIDNFEILWTKKNTKALKKLDPTMFKYNKTPIITTDDDILVTTDMVNTMVRLHKANPKYILGQKCICTKSNLIIVSRLRLYPPNSISYLPEHLYDKYCFGVMDDEWNAIRAMNKGVKSKKINYNLIENLEYCGKSSALNLVYRTFDIIKSINDFRKDYPEYFLTEEEFLKSSLSNYLSMVGGDE